MKKVYSKPCIAVENFVLQDSIAASCSTTINIGTQLNCGDTTIEGNIDPSLAAQIMGLVNMGYFTAALCQYAYSGDEPDSSDTICYFTSTNNLFSS